MQTIGEILQEFLEEVRQKMNQRKGLNNDGQNTVS